MKDFISRRLWMVMATAVVALSSAIWIVFHPSPVVAQTGLNQLPYALVKFNSAQAYEPVLDQLRQLGIPLRLPNVYPVFSEGVKYTVTLTTASSDGYTLIIGTSSPCYGGANCRVGTVSGMKLTSNSMPLGSRVAWSDPKLASNERSLEPPQTITLSSGDLAFFSPWVLGMSYSDSTLSWDERINGELYRYSVGLKKGDLQAVIAVAESTFEHVANPLDPGI